MDASAALGSSARAEEVIRCGSAAFTAPNDTPGLPRGSPPARTFCRFWTRPPAGSNGTSPFHDANVAALHWTAKEHPMRSSLLAGLLVLAAIHGAPAQEGTKAAPMGPETALLIIDIQNFYFEDGLVPLTGSVEAAGQARKVLDAFRAKKLPVIHVRHVPAKVAIVDGEPADRQYRIRPEVAPAAGETIISKRFANSFRETELLDHLRRNGITRLVIVGMQTHMCVEAASRAATDLGFTVTVLHDACATRPLTFGGKTVPADMVHAAALAAINGTYGTVMGVEEWLQGMSPAARVPRTHAGGGEAGGD